MIECLVVLTGLPKYPSSPITATIPQACSNHLGYQSAPPAPVAPPDHDAALPTTATIFSSCQSQSASVACSTVSCFISSRRSFRSAGDNCWTSQPAYKAIMDGCRGHPVNIASLSYYLFERTKSDSIKLEEYPSIFPCSVIHPETNSCLPQNTRATSATFRKTLAKMPTLCCGS